MPNFVQVQANIEPQPPVTHWFYSSEGAREPSTRAGIRRLYCDLIRLPDPFDVRALMFYLRN